MQIGKHLTLDEIEEVLKQFSSDKIRGLDGIPIELFGSFFDLVRDELLELVEYFSEHKVVSSALNYNFITLVPKCDKTEFYIDIRRILYVA